MEKELSHRKASISVLSSNRPAKVQGKQHTINYPGSRPQTVCLKVSGLEMATVVMVVVDGGDGWFGDGGIVVAVVMVVHGGDGGGGGAGAGDEG